MAAAIASSTVNAAGAGGVGVSVTGDATLITSGVISDRSGGGGGYHPAMSDVDLTAKMLTSAHFVLGDTLKIANPAEEGANSSFNATTDTLTITKSATTLNLGFNSTLSGDHFVRSANGAATDVSLAKSAEAILPVLPHKTS